MPPIPSKHRCPICKRACLKRAIVKNTNGSVIQIHIMGKFRAFELLHNFWCIVLMNIDIMQRKGERGLCCGEKNVKYVKKRATVALAKPTNTPEFAEL
ncbi:hypothetical protein RIR_jg36629.t1 [Rhizophagus irregularis DAOM 181602=DAOM 197198]|uniref:Uncharacterized protein n=1 Tax=Rhizophagus irregularis (strain DAOM 181602 / DAOM 197198 / MUCL 43194) TaxID=747089 RepID=U9UHX1_RHIID|nr:hypothetical protein RIR_jg36629.t1 [Rhizophagus irregularis DAOM 181602=DAOM 197198]